MPCLLFQAGSNQKRNKKKKHKGGSEGGETEPTVPNNNNNIGKMPSRKGVGTSVQIMNVYECNGTNIFMSLKINCSIQ